MFWKTQINVLRACPPLCYVVSGAGLGAAFSGKVWLKSLAVLAVQTPRAIFQHWHNRREGRVVLSRVTILVTTRCTLSCDKCAGHIPDCKRHEDVPIAELINDIRALLACVDFIYHFVITGGETFLYPDLEQLIQFCADQEKIGEICIMTNGTVIIEAKTLAALKTSKSVVKISKFPKNLQPNVEELKQTLKENEIRHLHEMGTQWDDMGKLGKLQLGDAEQRFHICFLRLCTQILRGRLYLCPKTALLEQEGILANCESDSIDLHATDPSQFAGKLRTLLKRPVVAACSYCLGCTYKTPKVPVAVQRSPNARKEAR